MMLTYSEILNSIDLNQFDLSKEQELIVFKSPKFTSGSETFTIGCHKEKRFLSLQSPKALPETL